MQATRTSRGSSPPAARWSGVLSRATWKQGAIEHVEGLAEHDSREIAQANPSAEGAFRPIEQRVRPAEQNVGLGEQSFGLGEQSFGLGEQSFGLGEQRNFNSLASRDGGTGFPLRGSMGIGKREAGFSPAGPAKR
jgi:hypothetical protein